MKRQYFLFQILLMICLGSANAQPLRDDINGEWSAQQVTLYDTPEAAVMVRVGDIDNLGFGWPEDFNPFKGASSPVHTYPFSPSPGDYDGTDRIMVVTSYQGNPPAGQDGYTSNTSRPENLPRPILMTYSLNGLQVNSAILQIFVDDFQAPVYKAGYTVTINGEPAPYFAEQINTLVQTGPVGKLITVNVPQARLALVGAEFLSIVIDDLTTGAGEGYAIDFVKLLVNPTDFAYSGTITGTVSESGSGNPIRQAVVSASGVTSATTNDQGMYTLENVPAGYVNLTAYAPGYQKKSTFIDVLDGQVANYDFHLLPAPVPECDTLHYPLEGTYVLFTVSAPESGFVCGNNSYGDLVKADFFESGSSDKRVYAALFEFGFVSIASGQNPVIEFKIWNDQGPGGYPGNVLGTATLDINQIFDDVLNEDITRVDFDPPVDVPGNFYIGVVLPTTEGDTLALLSTDEEEVIPGRAFEQWNDGSWHAFTEPDNWNINLGQAIYALYCDEGFGIDEPAGYPVLSLYPNPASDVVFVKLDNFPGNRDVVINIFSTLGNIVRSYENPKGGSALELPLAGIAPGIYLVSIASGNFRLTRKLIIH